jgi:sulfonate transport system substrate-binding protein
VKISSKKIGVLTALAALAFTVVSSPAQAAAPRTVALDYANWNPLSLVIKSQGWLDTDLKAANATATWVYSSGSAAAIQNLNANAIQLGSSAGAPAFVARANGVPIKTIGVFSQPNWAAIVVAKDSKILNPAFLKGKKIAAQKGTDPYFFLLQVLDRFHLSPTKDVTIVNLAHADGRAALERGDVDAWSGLDPITAQSNKIAGTKIIYQNAPLNSYGVLSAREDFIKSSPDIVKIILKDYEKARAWILKNPADAAKLLSDSAKIDLDVAQTVLNSRTRVRISLIPGSAQQQVLSTILPVLVNDAQVKSEADAKAALSSLYDISFATAVKSGK